jgi:hypothetical protein
MILNFKPIFLAVISRPTSDYVMPLQMCTYVPPEIKKVRERRRPTPYTVLSEQEEAPATMVLGGERGGKEEDDEKEEESKEGEGSIKVSGARGPRKRGTWKRGTWFRNHFLVRICILSCTSSTKYYVCNEFFTYVYSALYCAPFELNFFICHPKEAW